LPHPADGVRLRVLAAPDLGSSNRLDLDRLVHAGWTVRPDSDRMGVRLDGPRLDGGSDDGELPSPGERLSDGELLSHGVPWGAIQRPPSGLPIILAADHQSTGGYPVIAVVASVDLPVLGQLAPGDRVRLELVDVVEAHRALLDDDERFRRLTTQLEEARRVAELVDWAGA
jgi:antagonist of KipI